MLVYKNIVDLNKFVSILEKSKRNNENGYKLLKFLKKNKTVFFVLKPNRYLE